MIALRLILKFTFCIVVISLSAQVSRTPAQENRSPTVGATGRVEEVILPGSELIAKPIDDRNDEIVVRVVETFKHGDGYRYHIQFYGMEPGKYDLADWLVRKDGSSSEDLPEIPVEIRSVLPPGQIKPNDLETGWLPRMGGYTILAILATTIWILVFVALIFWPGRKKETHELATHTVTFADLLEQRIETALQDKMNPTQHAELERMLFAFWRKRLKLESMSPEQALARIKTDAAAGPLMNKLEEWMHSPNPQHDVDLKQLLKPYREMSVEENSSAIREHERAVVS